MEKIKISVIVPVYNVEKYVEECLESILNQSMKEIEIICINDGSTDSSLKFLNNYKKKYENIKIINQENGGLSNARNIGFSFSEGEYIFFIDSDDFFCDMNILETFYKKAKEKNLDFIEGNFNFYYSDKKKKIKARKNEVEEILVKGEERYRYLIENKLYASVVWNKLYKKDFLLKNKINFTEKILYEDVDFSYKVYHSAKKILCEGMPIINYRQRENSIMSDLKLDRINDYFKIIDSIESFATSNSLNKKTSNYIISSIILKILYKINYLKTMEEKEIMLKKIKINYLLKSGKKNYIIIGRFYNINKNLTVKLIKKIKEIKK